MTFTELSIKKPMLVVVFFAALGLAGIVSNFPLSHKVRSEMKPVKVSVSYPEVIHQGTVNPVAYRVEDHISSPEQNGKGNSIRISLPSGIMIENADREAIANMGAFEVLYMPAYYFFWAEEDINKNFQRENLPVIRISNLMDVKKADNEISKSFILGNAKILVDQKMLAVADKSMSVLFESSNQMKVKMIRAELIYQADKEITHHFKETIEVNSSRSHGLQTITSKA
jgi:hypothetical protein